MRLWVVRRSYVTRVDEEGIRVQNKRYAAALAAVAALVTVGACSNSGSDSQASPTNSPAASATSSPPVGKEAHNDADVMFAQGMIPHHEQAIEMSDMLLAKQGVDPRVASLANDIKAAQTPEIEQMQGWLTQWRVAKTTTSPSSSMPGHDMSGGDMPGMGGGHGMMSEQDMKGVLAACFFVVACPIDAAFDFKQYSG